MEWIFLAVAFIFTLLGLACVGLSIVSLPGVWALILLAVAVELLDGFWLGDAAVTFSIWTFVAAGVIALVGEILEFAASAMGAKAGGASKRGTWGALIGGIVGAIAGTPIFPVVGSILGAVAGAALGAIIGELTVTGATFQSSLKPATGAAAGRLAGTLAKVACALVVWIVFSVAAFWP
jgi:uncharacterized protein